MRRQPGPQARRASKVGPCWRGGVVSVALRELAVQEGGRLAEVALHRADGDAELLGDLLDGVAAEEAEFHDLALPLVQLGQAGPGLVDGQQVQALFGEVVQDLIQRQPLAPAAALVRGPPAGEPRWGRLSQHGWRRETISLDTPR